MKKTQNKNKFAETGIDFDSEGWALFPIYKPIRYELIEFQDRNGDRNKGWWTGRMFDYLKKRTTDDIIKWRYVHYE